MNKIAFFLVSCIFVGYYQKMQKVETKNYPIVTHVCEGNYRTGTYINDPNIISYVCDSFAMRHVDNFSDKVKDMLVINKDTFVIDEQLVLETNLYTVEEPDKFFYLVRGCDNIIIGNGLTLYYYLFEINKNNKVVSYRKLLNTQLTPLEAYQAIVK